MILPALRTEVSTLISRLNREGGPTATHPVVVRFDNGSHESITIHASRLTPPGASQPYLLLSFVPSPAPVTAPDPDLLEGGDGSDVELLRAQVAALDHELSGTREHLQAVVEELESSNEELQAMNEELQASAEELQATNEELETTNEELQATNEELTTVNETLQVRTVELTDTNEVLHAIQEAVHTAIVLVDNEQRVLQFSPLAVKVFGLVRGDVGLPLRGLPAHVDVPDLSEVVQGVIESGTGQALEVATTSAVYLLQVMPYRVANSTQGAVLAFSDITELAHARRELAVRGEEFRVLAEAVPYALYRSTVDRSRMLYLSATAETLLGLPTDQWAGVRLADFVHPDDRDRVVGAFADVVGDASVDYRIIVPGGAERVIRDISHVTGAGADATRVGALVDITDLVTARAQADTLWRRAEGVFALGGIPGAWVGPDARIREANRFLAALLHTDLAGLLDRPLLDVVSAQDRPRVQAAMDRIVSGAARVEQVPATLSAAVGPRVGLLTLACVSPDDTEGKAMLVTVHDATAERLALKQLEDSEHKLDAVFQGSGAPMAIMSGAGVVIRPNQALCDLLGYGPDELTGAHLDEFTHPDDLAVDQVLFAQLLDGRRRGYTVDKRYLAADGRVIWTRLTVNRGTAGPGDPIIVGSVLDITAEREREAHALVRAQSDPLTGLANRMLAFDRLRQSVRRAGRTGEAVSVLFIDLNGFKGVNDRLGHEVGDLVIRTMAERIAGVTRDSDTVARVGGDEFLVVAPHEGTDSSAEALHLAHRVLDAISLPVDLPASDRSPERTTSLTASIGLAQCPMDGTDVEELVRKADVAMYSAKHAGGNNVSVYSARLVDESRLMATLRADVIEGIRGGEFVPFYQPIVDAGSGAVRALEVLARWRHPERGVLSPAEFIDLVISFNQIEAFTASIIEQAVRDAGSFRAAQEGLSISLNLDPMQLRGSDVPGLLAQLLGPDLTGWTVEVTERAALGDDVAVYRALTELRGTGAKISLDDFGTGYSSVLHLKAWAFDEVKIDREFVSDVGEPGVRGLVATMVDMAHALGARAVAEGVESDAQAEVLRGMGVDLLQGYLFARPMPADELVAWFAEMSSR
jgi:diguanylate cyclase (GGDEF)-like protein/PAS domain S-box-containing protein